MPSYGRQLLSSTGRPVAVSIDGRPEWKVGGITLDWATVTAVGSDTTLADGTVVLNGQKGLEFGTVLCKITASGKYGPYASGASDGRQTLARDNVFILNETVLQNGPIGQGFAAGASDHPGVLVGGRVWADRVKAGGGGQPSVAALEAVMPRLIMVAAT
jgi:hypothetical protein